ncbi:MAG: hypothetical protein IPN67_16470 [Bacteroidales bacterium]|nr:hypothetical protein [Bacteroidales bacterium]
MRLLSVVYPIFVQISLFITTEINSQAVEQKENPYEGLRKMALGTKPEQLGLKLPSDKTIVYGVVMDWDVKNGTASTVAFMTGDASIYFSSGAGIIGGGTHENVMVMAMQFVEKAQLMLDKSLKTDLTPLPAANEVIFYFLTNKGIYTKQEELDNISNQSSIWVDLFLTGNEVITELRKTTEK